MRDFFLNFFLFFLTFYEHWRLHLEDLVFVLGSGSWVCTPLDPNMLNLRRLSVVFVNSVVHRALHFWLNCKRLKSWEMRIHDKDHISNLSCTQPISFVIQLAIFNELKTAYGQQNTATLTFDKLNHILVINHSVKVEIIAAGKKLRSVIWTRI